MALGNVLLFNVFGRLSDDLYQTLSAKYEAETRELKTRAAEIQALLAEATTKTQGIQDFTDLLAPYADITELDEELVHTLIEKIIVHEKEIINVKHHAHRNLLPLYRQNQRLSQPLRNPHKNKNRIRRCNGFYCLTYVVREK